MTGRRACLVSDCALAKEATAGLAAKLKADGWDVTILDSAPPEVADQKLAGFSYQRLAGLYQETNWYIQMQSLAAYHWLRAQNFDLILFQQGFATAFYSCSARHYGLAFPHTTLVVVADAPHMWALEQMKCFPSSRHDFEKDFMERKAVSFADALLLTNPTAFQWMCDAGWGLPVASLCLKTVQAIPALCEKNTDTPPQNEPCFISVCIATYNRPTLLREALAALQKQTHKSFEVVVVDDGSTDEGVATLQKECAPLFAAKKWAWVRQENAGPAKARNHGAKIAKSQHLLFMDDDNVAYPDEVERFATAAQKGYDILTCILGLHPESEQVFPPTAQLPERAGADRRPVGWTPIGGNVLLAAFINVMGDTNSLFRRDVFEKLGGFPSGKDVVFEDVELLTRALIAGYRIDVVPEVLTLYRRTSTSRSMGHDIFKGHLSSLKPIADLMPPKLRPLLLLLRREWYERHLQRRDGKI